MRIRKNMQNHEFFFSVQFNFALNLNSSFFTQPNEHVQSRSMRNISFFKFQLN